MFRRTEWLIDRKIEEERWERQQNDAMCRHMCYDAMQEMRERLDEIEKKLKHDNDDAINKKIAAEKKKTATKKK